MSDRGISLAEANDFKGDSRSSKGEMESGARLVENFPTAAQVGHEETCGGASDGNKQPDVESAADLREAEASQGPSAVEPTGFDLDMFAKQGVGHREHHEESAEDKLKFGHLDRTLEGASRLPVLDLGEADNSFPVGHDGMASDRATPAKAVADDGRLPVFLGGQETGAAVQAADRMIMGSSAGYASPETLRTSRGAASAVKHIQPQGPAQPIPTVAAMQKDVGSVSRVPEDPPKQRKAAKQRRSSVFGPMDTMPVLASQVGKLGAENHRMSIMSRANPTRQTPDASRREHQAPSSPKNLRRIPRRHSAGPFGQPFTDLPPNDHGKDGEETSHLPGGGVKQPADASRKNEEQLGQAKRKTISHVSSKATEHTLGFSGAEWIRQRRRTAGVLQAPEALASDSEIDTESSDDDDFEIFHAMAPSSTLLTEANRVVQSLVDRDTAGGALADTGSHSGIALELSEISAQLTQNQQRLLYLIGLYTSKPNKDGDEWIRMMPLMVLVYEGGLHGVFDYRCSPTPMWVHGHRIYLNLSQDGFADVDNLRNRGLVHALKITSETYVHSTAFRVSATGFEHLRSQLGSADKVACQRFASTKVDRDAVSGKSRRELLKVSWEPSERSFYLSGTVSGKCMRSTITDVGGVSYVMSPYLSRHLTTSQIASASLADRVSELEDATSNDKHVKGFSDNTLDTVRLMMIEWVPMGGNAIVALNDRLGVSERVQGGFFTAAVDKHPGATLFKGGRQGLTSVRPLDYDPYCYVNFEAEVFYPSEPGVVQLEAFSVHCCENGDIVYGGILEATTGCTKDKISIGALSRLIVDVGLDSSKVMVNLFDSHQTDMLNCILMDQPLKRHKFSCVIADAITTRIMAADLLDKAPAETKLKQAIGNIHLARDVGEHLLVVGRDGVLLAGPKSAIMEVAVVMYGKCCARSIFLKSIFSRCFIVVDILNQTRILIQRYVDYPEVLEHVRGIVASVSEDVLLLEEVQRAMLESITGLEEQEVLTSDPGQDADVAAVVEALEISALVKSLHRRAVDLQKTISACTYDMQTMRQMLAVAEEAQSLKLGVGLRDNTKNLEELFREDSRNSTSLEIINVVFAGSLAFSIMDRLTGGYLGMAASIDWIVTYIHPYITGIPFVWLGLNLLAWGVLAGFILIIMRVATYLANRLETSRQHVVAHVDLACLRAFLARKQLKNQSSEVDSNVQVNKYGWQEKRGGVWLQVAPKFELEVDERHCFLLSIATQVYKRAGALPMARAQLLLMVDLVLANVITMDVLLGMVSTTDHSVESFGDGAPPLIAEAETCVRLGDLPAEYDDILKELLANCCEGPTGTSDLSTPGPMSESSQFSQSPSRGLKNINKRMRRPKGGGAAMRRISLRNAGISIASTANKLKQQLSIALKNASTSIRSHQLSLVGRRWSAVVPFVEEDH